MKDAAGDLPDRSEVASFDQGKLKHVQTTEKNILPDKSSMYILMRLHITRASHSQLFLATE